MIFVFDTYERNGVYLPNLVTDTSIGFRSEQWWNLAITPPYSYEFRFLRYLWQHRIKYRVENVRDINEPCVYPVNLNYFDPKIDYISLVSESAKALARQGLCTIWFYYSEGDNIHWHIDRCLREQLDQHSIPYDQFKFTIANPSAEGEFYSYFPDDELYYKYLHASGGYITKQNLDQRTRKFTCLNRVDKPFRRLFAATLVERGVTDQAYFSYTDRKYQVEYETRDSDVSQWDTWDHTVLERFAPPYRCDELADYEHNSHKLIDERFFQDAYFNVIVETHINNLFLTEKTFKPILNLQPFVIVGAPRSLRLLRELGYKTFGDYVDESYDLEDNAEQRLKLCLKAVEQIAHMSHAEHQEMQQDMAEILLYNQQHFLSDKSAKLLNLLDKISQ
jgi:hypothetical protein